ncbi:MAG TPA: transposase [Terriglobales bacterium]|nr:transposase [Terriglobales bacterium]
MGRGVVFEAGTASIAPVRKLPALGAIRLSGAAIGYFEGIRSGARHCLAVGGFAGAAAFCGIALDEYTPDHSTISRTRRWIDIDRQGEVFAGYWACWRIAGR